MIAAIINFNVVAAEAAALSPNREIMEYVTALFASGGWKQWPRRTILGIDSTSMCNYNWNMNCLLFIKSKE